MADLNDPTPEIRPVEVEPVFRKDLPGPRKHSLIQNAAAETLRQWDEYRAQQREMFSKMTPKEQRDYHLTTMGLPTNDEDFKKLRDSLPDLDERDRLAREADARLKARLERAALERAHPWRTRWQRLKAWVGGLWKRKGNSGARSAPLTAGTKTTE